MILCNITEVHVYEWVITAIISAMVSSLITLLVQYISKKRNENIKINTLISIVERQNKSLSIEFSFENPSNVSKKIDNIEVIRKNIKNESEKLIQCRDQKMNLFGFPLVHSSDNKDKSFSLYLQPKSFTRIVLKFESLDEINDSNYNYFVKFNDEEHQIKLTYDPNKSQKLGGN